MHNDVLIIEKDPVRRGFSLYCAMVSEAMSHFLPDGFGDGFDLPSRTSGANDKIIGNRGEVSYLQDHDVGGFFIEGDASDNQGFVFDI